jgi:hypothetical protein
VSAGPALAIAGLAIAEALGMIAPDPVAAVAPPERNTFQSDFSATSTRASARRN